MIRSFFFTLCAIVCLSFQTSFSKVNVKKQAQQDLIHLVQRAREMVYDFQDNKPVSSLTVYYMNDGRYLHAKSCLSSNQQTRLITRVQFFDRAFDFPNKLEREQQVYATFGGLQQEVNTIRVESFHAAVPHVNQKAQQKSPAPKQVQSKNAPMSDARDNNNGTPNMQDEQQQLEKELEQLFKEIDEAELEKALAAMESNPLSSLMQTLFDNKKNIVLGLVTIYAMLAKANDWPPYDRKPKPESWKEWALKQAHGAWQELEMIGG